VGDTFNPCNVQMGGTGAMTESLPIPGRQELQYGIPFVRTSSNTLYEFQAIESSVLGADLAVRVSSSP